MLAIYKLMDQGGSNLSSVELKKFADMSAAVKRYEDEELGLKPKTKAKHYRSGRS